MVLIKGVYVMRERKHLFLGGGKMFVVGLIVGITAGSLATVAMLAIASAAKEPEKKEK